MALKGEIPGITKARVGRELNMSMSDPIADFLARIRNGMQAKKRWIDVPSSSMKKRIAYVLKEEKHIEEFLFSFLKVVTRKKLEYSLNTIAMVNP